MEGFTCYKKGFGFSVVVFNFKFLVLGFSFSVAVEIPVRKNNGWGVILLKPIKVVLNQGCRNQHLFGKGSSTVKMKAGLVVLNRGENIGEHITKGKEEAIIILQGSANIIINNELIQAEKDNVVYIPPETPHDVKNRGKGLLKYVYVVSYV